MASREHGSERRGNLMGEDWKQGGESGSAVAVTEIQRAGTIDSPTIADIHRRLLVPARKEPVPASTLRTRQRLPHRV